MNQKTKVSEQIIRELIKNRAKAMVSLDSVKRKIARNYKVPTFSNIELLKAYHKALRNKSIKQDKIIENLLIKRRIRSLSGVVVVSILTKPYPCPGKCFYCPNEKGMPKSYLSNEPAVMRAVLNDFDPAKQVKSRIQSLELTGHSTDKIELIVIGGTWSALPKQYQSWFIKRCFEACNGKKSKTLDQAQKQNEKAKHRIIGLTLETRPDFITKDEIKRMRMLGATRCEIGVQSIYDDILKLNKRGHLVSSTIKATKLLKDAGFKVCYHIMVNLPGSNLRKDKEVFKQLFSSQNFQPDLLKIYPCAILKEAPLYKLWKKGGYKPYTKKALLNLLISAKKTIPYYCRIQRIIRDIPSSSILTGPAKVSNMRQMIARQAKEDNWRCRCIRCREVKENYNPKEKLYLFRQDYEASMGKEIFLSYEDKKQEKLYSLLRLRIPSQVFTKEKHFIPTLENTGIIREVHTFGKVHPLNQKAAVSPQHKGLGKKLIKQAEKIAKIEFGLNKMAVISGIGVRKYYCKLGYKLKGNYMLKNL